MAKVGRKPFEITPEIIKQVEALAAQGLTQEQIGVVIGISHQTMAKYKNKNIELNKIYFIAFK